jgi:hypothetical protein
VSCSSRGFHFSKIWPVNRRRQIALSHSRNAVSLFIGVHNEALTVTTIRVSHKKIVHPVESTVASDVANTLTFFATSRRKNRRIRVKAFPQIQQSPSGYALPGAKRFLSESLGFQFYEHSVKLPKLQETRRTKSRYGSLKSPLCSCVSITLPASS